MAGCFLDKAFREFREESVNEMSDAAAAKLFKKGDRVIILWCDDPDFVDREVVFDTVLEDKHANVLCHNGKTSIRVPLYTLSKCDEDDKEVIVIED
tara:strand:+ start:151 stop:438 length:288 start_codon:yes stop_codon:yes gene_type:complete